MMLHARIGPTQIDGLIMRPSRPSFCVMKISDIQVIINKKNQNQTSIKVISKTKRVNPVLVIVEVSVLLFV